MKRSRIWLSVAASATLVLAACGGAGTSEPADGGEGGGEAATVQLQLQWAPQAQFAGYFAAVEQGYYDEENLTSRSSTAGRMSSRSRSAPRPTARSSRSAGCRRCSRLARPVPTS